MKNLNLLEKVKDYEFSSLEEQVSEDTFNQDGKIVSDFTLNPFDLQDDPESKKMRVSIKEERRVAVEKNFKISPIVKAYRGIEGDEYSERKRIIDEKVNKKLDLLKEETIKNAYEEGIKKGKEEIYKELMESTDEKLSSLTTFISEALVQKEVLLKNKKWKFIH